MMKKGLLLSGFLAIVWIANLGFSQKDSVDLLKMSLKDLMEISVFSASKKEQKLMEAPAIMTVLNRGDLERIGGTTIIDALKFVPGVEVSLSPDGNYRISLRGNQKEGNILFLVNGQQMNDFYTGSAVFDYPLAMVEKIEVIRGPGSALFGTNAVAGVIHVFLREGTSVEALGGMNQTYGAHFNLDKQKNNLRFQTRIGYLSQSEGGQDIETDAGDKPGNLWDLTLDSLNHEGRRSKQDIYANFNVTSGDFSCYGNALLRNRSDWSGVRFIVAPESEIETRHFTFGAKYRYRVSDRVHLVPKVYGTIIQQNNLWQETPKNYLSNLSGDLFPEGRQTHERYLAKMYGTEIDFYIKVNERLNLISGNIFEDLSLSNYDIERNYQIVGDQYKGSFGNYDSIQFHQDGKRRFVFAYFLQADYKWNKFSMTFGLRYDDYSDFGISFNPRVGLTYNLSKNWYLKGLYGKAFRAPTFQELYDNTSLGNQYGVKGNEDLRAENMQTFELAVEYQVPERAVFRYNGYLNLNSHLIRIYDPHGGGSIGFYQNIGSTQTIGHEFDALINLSKYLRLNVNISQFQSLFDWDEGNVSKADVTFLKNQDKYYRQLFHIPAIRSNAGLNLVLKKISLYAGIQYGSKSYNNNRFYLEKGSFVIIPSYVQSNFSCSFDLNKQWQFSVVMNSLGTKYSAPDESTNIDVYGSKGLIQPGVNLFGCVKLKLN
ncbi:MAG: TonB-dependent receptor [Bacteroidetes bacterium]|nr:MAG: TonB-dependent receptor [Bacteroidota bacterium]